MTSKNQTTYNQIKKSLCERFCPGDYVFVDLGLPSGNLWMDRNLDASNTMEFGGYYMWGDLKKKQLDDTYYFDKGENDTFKKYNHNNLTELELSDDIAYQTIGSMKGGIVKIPSLDDFIELEHLENKWTDEYDVPGRLFIGYNGNTLFMPAAGYMQTIGPVSIGQVGYYWSSTLDTSDVGDDGFAYTFTFQNTYHDCYTDGRLLGFSIRPVLIHC